jgi:pyridoxal phosphate enzyme (YggS family)
MSVADNLKGVLSRIEDAAKAAGRDPAEVRLVAVTKTKPAEAVREALAAGQTIFGENYIQESQDKIPQVGPQTGTAPVWHFIGHLQSNKAKIAAQLFDVVQTVDRLKIAGALSRHAAEQGKTLGVLLQVNVGQEPQKSGCTEEDAPALARAVAQLPGLKLMGLMTMPPFFDDPERARPHFAALRELSQRMASDLPAGTMDELSMGMSGDFEAAIAEGATLVRVGTAIFGSRY